MSELSIFVDEYAYPREDDPAHSQRTGTGRTAGGGEVISVPPGSIFFDEYDVAASGISRGADRPDHSSARQAGNGEVPLDSIFYDDYAAAA
ncbi:MAG TPA: hypothetical protein VGS28_03055 [Candidatus Saccharimonadales bacterium]|nr:hypothetical protein [Candidatus Saccharimonadales bacterium]